MINDRLHPASMRLTDWALFSAQRIWQTGAVRTPWISLLAIAGLILLLGWPSTIRLADALPPADLAALPGWVAQRALLASVLAVQAGVILVASFAWAAAPSWPERTLSLEAYALASPVTSARWLTGHLLGVGLVALALPAIALPLDLLAAGIRPLGAAVPPLLLPSRIPAWLGIWAVACFSAWWWAGAAAGVWAGLQWEPATRRVATAGLALLATLSFAVLLFGSMGPGTTAADGSPTAFRSAWTRLSFCLNPVTPLWLLVTMRTVPAARALEPPTFLAAGVALGAPLALAFLISWGVVRRVRRLRATFPPPSPARADNGGTTLRLST